MKPVDSLKFHGLLDDNTLLGVMRTPLKPRVAPARKHIIEKEWKQDFKFAPHFHPYSADLIKKLLEKSVPGLIAADTAPKQMEDGTSATFPQSVEVSVPKDSPLELREDVMVTVPPDTKIVLEDGSQAELVDQTLIVLRDGTSGSFASDAKVWLPDGTKVSMDGIGEAILPGNLLNPHRGEMQVVIIPSGGKETITVGSVITLSGMTLESTVGPVTIFHEVWVILSGMSVLKLNNGIDAELSMDAQIRRNTGASEVVPRGTSVKLADANGVPAPIKAGTSIKLMENTKVEYRGAKPLPELYEDSFRKTYQPSSTLVQQPYPISELDFSSSGAYSVYNWELFYHVPFTIAVHLSKNQRFEEAQRWFHYIFDPTDDSDGPTPERFWRVKPFQTTPVKKIEDLLIDLSAGAASAELVINSINKWEEKPFRPHAVARFRQSAYMFKTVMAYLDNLIAWSDSLFRQDTRETINEATQLYVLAANILGRRPQPVPKKGVAAPRTYRDLRKAGLDQFGNALVEMETDIPFDVVPLPNAGIGDRGQGALESIGRRALYFCVPPNDMLMRYWDTVADRLFKIHNSLNIQGVFRQLPLFEPPIDPALLAKGVAAGLDIGAVISGMNQPLPLVRFQFLVQKAAEICQEVKSLGNNLLAAMEKEDNEALSILRAKHEGTVLGLAEMVKYAQLQESIKSREGLEQSLENAVERYIYYGRLVGEKESDLRSRLPKWEKLDTSLLEKLKLNSREPEIGLRDITVDIAADAGQVSDGDVKTISTHESKEIAKLGEARDLQVVSGILENIASGLSLIPQFEAKTSPIGVGAGTGFGGVQLSRMFSGTASAGRMVADKFTYEAGQAAKIGSYARREQEWTFQSNVAAGEITQIYKQLRAAEIREAIADREWKNHKKQMEHAREIEDFLANEKNGKKTNQAFYAWMKREIKGLYGACFQFAFDIAKKAERALQHELGDPNLSFLQFGYLAGKEGLLAGEKLYLDIKRMEMAYHDLNQREYELTKPVSLLQVDPIALLELRATGSCEVSLPEDLFDLDCPGHYFRRIRSVAVSIPCIVGPYANVNCKLTLLKSEIRILSSLNSGYLRGAEDNRFSDYFGSVQAIVTSSGQSDSGLFETNLRDERYLPFEGAGVVSRWRLELPNDPRKFDYDSIADVILHLRYTARDGGNSLRDSAVSTLKSRIEEAQVAGSVRLFSMRHEFPTEWARFKNIKVNDNVKAAKLTVKLKPEHYPFWSQGRLEVVKGAELFARVKNSVEIFYSVDGNGQPTGKKDVLDKALGHLWGGKLANLPLKTPTEECSLYFKENSIEDLWFALRWGKAEAA